MAVEGEVNILNAAGTACCPCSEQLNCSCSPICGLVCQSRTSPDGTAHFCSQAFAEFANPSNPPIYYRTMSLSGSTTVSCGGPSCSPVTPNVTLAYSGQNNVDKNTCIYTEGGILSNSISGNSAASDVSSSVIIGAVGGVTFNISDGFTQTEHYLISNGAGNCVLSGSGFTGCIQPTCNGINSVLSNQDLPTDAIARAVVGRAWGGVDCTLNFSSISTWGHGSRQFSFRQAQCQVTYYGVPGSNHNILVGLWQRPAGSTDPLVEVGGLNFGITVPPSGNAVSAFQIIPTQVGYDTFAQGCTVTS